MKLLIISLVIFVLCCGLPGFVNARNLVDVNFSNNGDEKCPHVEVLPESSTFFLYVGLQNISVFKCSEGDYTLSNIKTQNYSDLSEIYNINGAFTYNCARNYMYILKLKESRDRKRVLEVLHFNKNEEFQRVNEVPNMFDNAISISSDWRTGKLYWTEHTEGYSSIKVTDKSFNNFEYVIHPKRMPINKLLVYPKRKEIFFLGGSDLYYTSNAPNSTASLLFPSVSEFEWIEDFAIDYGYDNLCWILNEFGDLSLNCIEIKMAVRPLKFENIVKVNKMTEPARSFAVYYNQFYWTSLTESHYLKLPTQIGRKGENSTVSIPGGYKLFLLYIGCPYNKKDEEEFYEDYNDEEYDDDN